MNMADTVDALYYADTYGFTKRMVQWYFQKPAIKKTLWRLNNTDYRYLWKCSYVTNCYSRVQQHF
jgi:hypothetical protein